MVNPESGTSLKSHHDPLFAGQGGGDQPSEFSDEAVRITSEGADLKRTMFTWTLRERKAMKTTPERPRRRRLPRCETEEFVLEPRSMRHV